MYRELADGPAATGQALEISKFSEGTYAQVSQTETLSLFLPVTSQYRDPDSFQTTSNEAYTVVKRQTGRGRGEIEAGAVEAEYEDLPPPISSQPTTTALTTVVVVVVLLLRSRGQHYSTSKSR